MSDTNKRECVRIKPGGFETHEYAPDQGSPVRETYQSRHGVVGVVWLWDGAIFRMDLTAPQPVALDIALPTYIATVYVNGELVWAGDVFQANRAGVAGAEKAPTALHLTCPAGGTYHILARAERP